MIPVSESASLEWEKDIRKISARLKEWDNAHSEWITVSNEIKDFEIVKGMCDESFSYGTAYAPTCTITLDGSYAPSNSRIINVDLGIEYTIEDSTVTEYMTIGRYYIESYKINAWTTSLTCVSPFLGENGKNTYTGTTIKSVGGIINIIENALSITIDGKDLIDTTVSLTEAITSGTVREALAKIALCFGVCVVEECKGTVSGNDIVYTDTVSFKRLLPNRADGISLNQNRLSEPYVSNGEYEITGHHILVTESDGSASAVYIGDTTYNYEYSNQYMTNDMWTKFQSNKQSENLGWNACEINIPMGNPRLEVGDIIQLTIDDNTTKTIRCFEIRHKYDGGLTTTITAPSLGNDSASEKAGVTNQVLMSLASINNKLSIASSQLSSRIIAVSNKADEINNSKLDAKIQNASCEWDEETNTLRIGGASSDVGNDYYEISVGGDGINFKYGQSRDQLSTVAYINQEELRINKTVVYDSSVVGDWKWETNKNKGTMTLKWKGGNA